MRKNAKELLKHAKQYGLGKRAPEYKDNKCLCDIEDISILLGSRATPMVLNNPTMGGDYVHEVLYKGHTFIAVTSEPIKEFKNYKEACQIWPVFRNPLMKKICK